MELLDIATIRHRLDDQFVPLEPNLNGFRMIESVTPSSHIEACERRLGVTFPEPFARMVSQFNFGNFTVGPVAFCNTGNYLAWLAATNEASQSYPWWGNGVRPTGVVLIANSDPFAILLDTTTGKVYAFLHGRSWQNRMKIANDFEGFLCGLGTVMLERNPTKDNLQLAKDVAAAVDAQVDNGFWFQISG